MFYEGRSGLPDFNRLTRGVESAPGRNPIGGYLGFCGTGLRLDWLRLEYWRLSLWLNASTSLRRFGGFRRLGLQRFSRRHFAGRFSPAIHVRIDLLSDFCIGLVHRLVGFVPPSFYNLAHNWKLPILKIHRPEKAFFPDQKNQHLLPMRVAVLGTLHVRSRKNVNLLEGEVAFKNIHRMDRGQLSVTTSKLHILCAEDFHSSNQGCVLHQLRYQHYSKAGSLSEPWCRQRCQQYDR